MPDRSKTCIAVAMAGVAALSSGAADAQDWPTRPVTMVVAFAPGGPVDTLARLLQPHLSEALGQQVIVENVAGGGGTTGSLRVANAGADSHMFTLGSIGTHAINQSMHRKPPYDAVADFTPVMLVVDAPQVLLARKDLPASNLREFAAYARANADKMQHGSGGAGTSSHIGCVLLNQTLGVKVTHIPYRGGGPALQDLLAGRIDYICNYISTALGAHKNKTAKVIAALTSRRTPSFPDVSTAQEEGFPGLDISAWNAVFMPKQTPAHMVQKLNGALGKALEAAALRKRLEDIGLEVPAPERRTPAYLARFVASEIKRWEAPVRASGATFD
jgi:tripartite-type tricarboxylate transporter receptor subunit TctC